MVSIHDWDKRMNYAMSRLDSSIVSDGNKHLIKDFVNYSLASGISKARIERYITVLRQFGLQISKGFKDLDKSDFIQLIGLLESSNYKLWTKVTYKTVLRKFVTWLYDVEEAPACVKWIDVSSKNVKRMPEEILTQEEVKQLIEGAKYERDKALISVLYESGCR
ncbi:MAG TPA: hypothetical protein VI790_06350, partial [Candidatus Nanoarchaeia archaeon]|nr:hypothetical protein [Candidatus Nanoarchaeia archaeon]